MRVTLASLRQGADLTQRELADRLTKSGVKCSPAAVALYELGLRTPGLEKARAIAGHFGVSVDDVVFGPSADETRAGAGGQVAVLAPTGTD